MYAQGPHARYGKNFVGACRRGDVLWRLLFSKVRTKKGRQKTVGQADAPAKVTTKKDRQKIEGPTVVVQRGLI